MPRFLTKGSEIFRGTHLSTSRDSQLAILKNHHEILSSVVVLLGLGYGRAVEAPTPTTLVPKGQQNQPHPAKQNHPLGFLPLHTVDIDLVVHCWRVAAFLNTTHYTH